ncbi:unnamed protein product [Dracunculus medinensis]|uniref:Proteasome assembly chaperone 2 n=1 Tax=Dracunculus medinensis TaxID=318479 RepID=A0A0N4UCB3_DRAME|nr:unnamed protein product [Dracunculus medinensis]
MVYLVSFEPAIIVDLNYGRISKNFDSGILLDVACSPLSKICYNVYDIIESSNTKSGIRVLGLKDSQKGFETMVPLIAPKNANSAYSDTRIWKIDHSHLKLQYTASLITASFVTSSLPYLLGTAMEGKMILIGLGGGSERYDTIIIDACSNNSILPCPSEQFANNNFIELLSKYLMKPSGSLVVNILNLSNDDSHHDMIVAAFRKHFRSCVTIRLKQELNIILTCVLYNLDDLPAKYGNDFAKRFEKIWHYFGFSLESTFQDPILENN